MAVSITPGARPHAVVRVRDATELKPHLEAWDDLAGAAIEPNVFNEPAFLLAAAQAFGEFRESDGSKRLEFVLVYRQGSGRVLDGFFPLDQRAPTARFPLRHARLWQHHHNYLCAPLVRTDFAAETLDAFFDDLGSGAPPVGLIKFPLLAEDGAFRGALLRALERRGASHWVSERYSRALFRRERSWEAHQSEVFSRNLRKQLRRSERRLSALGQLEHVVLVPGRDLDAWLEEFLALEAAGWKGLAGGALASTPAGARFFVEMVTESYRRGQLFASALRLDGKPVAMHCDLLSGDGCFGFKSAYDEAFADGSPGLLLERELLAEVHRRRIDWVDSCAAAGHSVLERVWNAQRPICSLWAATGGLARLGPPLLNALDRLRHVRRGRHLRA